MQAHHHFSPQRSLSTSSSVHNDRHQDGREEHQVGALLVNHAPGRKISCVFPCLYLKGAEEGSRTGLICTSYFKAVAVDSFNGDGTYFCSLGDVVEKDRLAKVLFSWHFFQGLHSKIFLARNFFNASQFRSQNINTFVCALYSKLSL